MKKKIGIISDTHDLLRPEVVSALQGCDAIFHCGDICEEYSLDGLSRIAPIWAVRGNNDIWQDGLRDLAGVLRFEIGGVRFVMTHERWDVPRDLAGVDAVICGHSHRYSEEWIDGRLWLNPGSCGRARFGGDVTMAKLILRGGKIARVERIDLEERDG